MTTPVVVDPARLRVIDPLRVECSMAARYDHEANTLVMTPVLYVSERTSDRAGRNKWRKVIGPLAMADEEHGDATQFSDLLRRFADYLDADGVEESS